MNVFLDVDGDYDCVGSAHGLFCIKKRGDRGEVCFQFWHPLMRLKSLITVPLVVSPHEIKIGFGFDSLSQTYKVIVLMFGLGEILLKAHTMGTMAWKRLPSLKGFSFLAETYGQYVMDTLNWLALNDTSRFSHKATCTDMQQLVIFSLHLNVDHLDPDLDDLPSKFLHVPRGLDIEVPEFEPVLSVLSDSLCLVIFLSRVHKIWQMKEFRVIDSWSIMFIVNYDHLGICPFLPLQPLCLVEDVNVLVMVDNIADIKLLYLYDRRVNIFVGQIEIPVCRDVAWDYLPCLVQNPNLELPG
ncbi:hypothetical protein RIF29_40524 [Crotalaria pallida]|uniref:F-box associated domain-containing protein n=1 Tax=Crotalaria pallida TaxID=3830 RepID=A0AAN9E422_CROPI